MTFGSVGGVLVLTAIIACAVPALRAVHRILSRLLEMNRNHSWH